MTTITEPTYIDFDIDQVRNSPEDDLIFYVNIFLDLYIYLFIYRKLLYIYTDH